jgi:hypothetical protein
MVTSRTTCSLLTVIHHTAIVLMATATFRMDIRTICDQTRDQTYYPVGNPPHRV